MAYMLLLHCLHPYLLQLSFCHYSYYVIINYILLMILKYNKFYLLAEITLKLGLQSTEAYFPYIAYACIIMYEGVSYLKFMLLILKLLRFFIFFVGDHGKLFLKTSQMLVVCIPVLLLQLAYISLFCIREERCQKYNSDPEGCPVDWQDLMMVLVVQ